MPIYLAPCWPKMLRLAEANGYRFAIFSYYLDWLEQQEETIGLICVLLCVPACPFGARVYRASRPDDTLAVTLNLLVFEAK